MKRLIIKLFLSCLLYTSSLSGVGKRINENQELVYQRSFEIPSAWKGKQVLLHFGAVDWKTEIGSAHV